jgi:CubicO group peptidase (beta-lactamase class C family)
MAYGPAVTPKILHLLVLACTCAILAWGCSSSEAPRAAPAPGESWPTAPPEEQGFDSALLAQVVEQIDQQEDLPVDSLQVARNGVLILDAYFYPYLEDGTHDVASVTKSVTSTLVGIAVDQGLLTLDQNMVASFPDLVPVPPSDDKADIELHHLLTMTSGMDCGRTPGEPELHEMKGSDNYVEYALDLPMAVPPETEFAYCSPGSHLVSAMLDKATGTSALDFAWDNLFGPLGIEDAEWPEDPQGVSHGWGDLRLHPRDMARVGQLFLNAGDWNGTQVVSRRWVGEATRTSVVVDTEGTGYGYQWWVLAGAFEGLYEALGDGGQAIIVWPDKDVVAVFTGRGVDVLADVAPLVAAALQSDAALDPNPEAYARLNTAIQDATEPPMAKPAPPLPPMATEISGKVYRLDPNELDVQCISLRFDSPSEVWLELTLGSGVFDLPVGMDGVPRFSESGLTGIPIGVLGEWTDSSIFEMALDEVGGPNYRRVRGDFDDTPESVELEFSDPGGYLPPQTVQAASVSACD